MQRAAGPCARAGLGVLLGAVRAVDFSAGRAKVSGWLPEPVGFPGGLLQWV